MELQTVATRAEPLEKERANMIATPPDSIALKAGLELILVVNGALTTRNGALATLYGGTAALSPFALRATRSGSRMAWVLESRTPSY